MCLLLLNDCTVSLLRASIRDAPLSSFTSHSSVVCESKKWTLNSILTIIHGALCNYLFRWCLSYSPFSNVPCRKIQVKKNNCNVHFPHRIKTHFVQIIAVLLFDDLHCKKRKSFFFLRHKNPEKLECLEFCSTLSQDVQHFMMLLPKWHGVCCVLSCSLGSE